VLKVRPPLLGQETERLKEGSTVISFLYPAQNKAIVDTLSARKVNAFAVSVPNNTTSHALNRFWNQMDMIPRISRAQVFDALRLVT
jgi:NAD(P) transhydrogenase